MPRKKIRKLANVSVVHNHEEIHRRVKVIVIKRYFLVVEWDGTEHVFATEPAKPSLYVERIGALEFTHTRNVEKQSGAYLQILSVVPRGKDWSICGDPGAKFTTWQRSVRQSVHS